MLVVIKGAGDIASGIALRLYRSGFDIIMTEIEKPTTVRRTVAFSSAVYEKSFVLEGVCAELAGKITPDTDRRQAEQAAEAAKRIIKENKIAVVIDPEGRIADMLRPEVVIDAILAKKNTGTKITDAPVVIGVGPGFTAGEDCSAVVETKRGHTLGRVIYSGRAIEDTGEPGNVGGYTFERLLKTPCSGVFRPSKRIGDLIEKGEQAGFVEREDGTSVPVTARLSGTLRGLLAEGVHVCENMKAGDVDPRQCRDYCFTVSDKALAVGGGTLEAILNLSLRGERL